MNTPVSKSTVTHDLLNSDLLLQKISVNPVRGRVRVRHKWPQTRCLVAATVGIQDSDVRFTCRTFGLAHAS